MSTQGVMGTLAAMFAVSVLGCELPRQPDVPLTSSTNEDPDALCAGAERVFLRHAIHLESDTCATEARALVTELVSFEKLKIGDATSHKSFSVIISRGTVEIAASCASLGGDGKMSPTTDCSNYPETAVDPTAITKERLIEEIEAESRAVAGARRTRDQNATPAAAVVPASAATPGCSKDTDCKGARICMKGECVEPPSGGGTPP